MPNSNKKLFLGIESSCDECSISVVEMTSTNDPLRVRSMVTFSQIHIHQPYGGVVPEIASRNHLETINPVLTEALKQAEISPSQLTAICVTNRPGLIGALLVGVTCAKALAYAFKIPLVPVHHLEAHACSLFLGRNPVETLHLPMLLGVISGGHSNLYVLKAPPTLWPPDHLKRSLIGRSRDDAAGEAFDKIAKLLGYDYPGGVAIDREALNGNPEAFQFPRALQQKDNFDFSFSGLKTSAAQEIARILKKDGPEGLQKQKANLCASLQEAIVDSLWTKIKRACTEHQCKSLAIVGGVAANSRLRALLEVDSKNLGLATKPLFPDSKFCTDNGAMVAAAGAFRFLQGHYLRPDSEELLTLNALAGSEV